MTHTGSSILSTQVMLGPAPCNSSLQQRLHPARGQTTPAHWNSLVLVHPLESTLIPSVPFYFCVHRLSQNMLLRAATLNFPFSYPGHTLTDSICQVGFPPLNAWFSPGKSCCPAEAGHQPAERCPLFSGNGWQPRSSGASVNASQHLSQRPLTSSNVFSFSSFSSDVCGGQHRSTLLKNLILADACRRSSQRSAPRKTTILAPHPSRQLAMHLWTNFSCQHAVSFHGTILSPRTSTTTPRSPALLCLSQNWHILPCVQAQDRKQHCPAAWLKTTMAIFSQF